MCWDPSRNLLLDLEGIDRLQTRWSQRGLLELCIYGTRAFGQFFGSCEDGAPSCVCQLELQLEESEVCSTRQNFFGSWYFVSSFEVCSNTSELSPQHWFERVAHHVLFGVVKDNLFGAYGNRNLALWWSLSCRKSKS
ncbi:hypothetical protein CsSME_00043866 [Camellia sinensis var. sinensis]